MAHRFYIGALWRIDVLERSGGFAGPYIGALWRIGRFNGGYGGFGPLVSGFRHGKFVWLPSS
jgi:hypothetical protein